jgi:hypothetical protein
MNNSQVYYLHNESSSTCENFIFIYDINPLIASFYICLMLPILSTMVYKLQSYLTKGKER